MKHCDFSPSSLPLREQCPASYKIELGLPDVATEHATSGTILHEVIAKRLSIILGLEDVVVLPVLEDDDARLVDKVEEKFFEVLLSLGIEADNVRDCINDGSLKVCIENPIDFYKNKLLLFRGTADIIISYKGNVIIIDWKTGRKLVDDAEDNLQGCAYALAVQQMMKCDSVKVIFYNPRINQFSEYEFTQFDSMGAYIEGVIMKCLSETPDFGIGRKCKYCKGYLHAACPFTKELSFDLANIDTSKEMTHEELCEYKEKLDIVADLAKIVDAKIKSICESDGHCGNIVIREISNGDEVVDINRAFSQLSEYISANDFMSACSVSTSKLAKALTKVMKEDGEVKNEREGKERMKSLLGDNLIAKPFKKQLVKMETE